jgi:type 1 glutamine amidotransferase
MRTFRWLSAALTVVAAGLFSLAAADDSPSKKRLLLVTDSGGFVHDSVGVAEEVLKEIGPQEGFSVTAWRFTRDPDPKVLEKYGAEFRKKTGLTVGPENCGRINKETLKKFDCVLFFTTGNPVNKEELADLIDWVKAGGAFAGTHCATDSLYKDTIYGELVGAYFDLHPWHQKIKVVVEDPKHPAAAGFTTGTEITDEIYQFAAKPYSREKLHVIMSVDNSSIDTNKKDVHRTDKDFAIAWCHEFGKGKSFYTSLGHRREVWKDPRFQQHLMGGLKWATGMVPGDATPSGKK